MFITKQYNEKKAYDTMYSAEKLLYEMHWIQQNIIITYWKRWA